MTNKTPPALSLGAPTNIEEFINRAPVGNDAPAKKKERRPPSEPAPKAKSKPVAPKRGHIIQASGKQVRRLVLNVPVEVGEALDKQREETGAPISFIATKVLKDGLGLK